MRDAEARCRHYAMRYASILMMFCFVYFDCCHIMLLCQFIYTLRLLLAFVVDIIAIIADAIFYILPPPARAIRYAAAAEFRCRDFICCVTAPAVPRRLMFSARLMLPLSSADFATPDYAAGP